MMDDPVSYCCECGEPIYECMGTTLAEDILKCIRGEITVDKIRQGCPRCATRWANREYFKRTI